MTKTEPEDLVDSVEQPFTIHLLNTYDSVFFPVIADEFKAEPDKLQEMARGMHEVVVKQLASGGIKYEDLRNALTPTRGKKQVAFIFDSVRAGEAYGEEISKSWLPTLSKHGPEKTAIMRGDLIGLSAGFVHAELEKHLVGAKDFPRLPPVNYYVVYFTNLTNNQLTGMAAMLEGIAASYLGYVDCSTWTPLKHAMALPQFGLRLKKTMIMPEFEGDVNPQGYPLEEHGFKILGVEQEYYDALLTF